MDADYTVGSLAARQQGDVTLAFTPPGTFGLRKIYTTGAERGSNGRRHGDARSIHRRRGRERRHVRVRDTSNGQANLNLAGTLLTTAGAGSGEGQFHRPRSRRPRQLDG